MQVFGATVEMCQGDAGRITEALVKAMLAGRTSSPRADLLVVRIS